jgi:hypothetical protein
MYGLRNMSSRHESVRLLLHTLTSKLETCEEKLSSQVIGISLRGLDNMCSRHSEVLAILRVLSEKIQHSSFSMDGITLGSLYGLNKMNADKPEVLQLVEVLSEKLTLSTEMFEPHHLASALFGLQLMNARCQEVQILVQVLADKIDHNCDDFFPPESLDLALRGVRAMSSVQPEVRALIRALAKKVKKNSKFEVEQFVSISASLSMKSCEFPEVRELYQVFAGEIMSCSQVCPCFIIFYFSCSCSCSHPCFVVIVYFQQFTTSAIVHIFSNLNLNPLHSSHQEVWCLCFCNIIDFNICTSY